MMKAVGYDMTALAAKKSFLPRRFESK